MEFCFRIKLFSPAAATAATMSQRLILYIFMWSALSLPGTTAKQCQQEAEESKPYKIYSNIIDDPGLPLAWDLGGRILYHKVDHGNSTFTLHDNFTVDTTSPWTWIQIDTIERYHSGIFTLFHTRKSIFKCHLEVYRRPETPTCTLDYDSDNTVTISCTTAKVFPEALCKLFVKTWTDKNIKYTHQELEGEPTYYSTTCHIRYDYDVTDMEEGIHPFTVAMFPKDTGLSETLGNSSTELSLTLSLPTVSLTQCLQGTNVTDGYLLQGTTATCTCNLAHPGKPKGSVQWSSSPKNGSFSIQAQTGRHTQIQINSAGTFTCEGRSALKGPYHRTEETLKNAYGPTSAQTKHNTTGPIDLCPSTSVSVGVQCSVKKSDVQPEPTFELLYSPQDTFTRVRDFFTNSPTADKYTHNYILEPLVGGSHTLNCVSRNSKFADVSVQSSATVVVRAPPKSAPKLKVRGSRTDRLLVEKDNVTVACTVTGGSPPVESVTITCEGREVVTASGTSVTLTWPGISVNDNGAQCNCSAFHVTQCYDLTAAVILDVVATNSSRLVDGAGGGGGGGGGGGSIGIAVGAAVGGAVLVIAIIAVVLFLRRRRRAKKEPERTEPAGYDPAQDPGARVVDNDVLYNSGKELANANNNSGYNPMNDPDAVVVDNSALYGTSSGYNPLNDPDAVIVDNSALYGTASGYNPLKDPDAVVEDNSALYGTASGYDPQNDPDAVVVDNSALYYSGKDLGDEPSAAAKNYQSVRVSIVSAAAPPKLFNPENEDNPYEDVDMEKRIISKPLIATKPQVANKPKATSRPKVAKKPKEPKELTPDLTKKPSEAKEPTPELTQKPSEPNEPSPEGNVYSTVKKAGNSFKTPVQTEATEPEVKPPTPDIPKKHYDEIDLVDPVDKEDLVDPVVNGDLTDPMVNEDLVDPVVNGDLADPIVNGDLTESEVKKDPLEPVVKDSQRTSSGSSNKRRGKKKGPKVPEKRTDHTYTNAAFDVQEGEDTYSNATALNSLGRYSNNEGLIYTTLDRAKNPTPVHHPRREEPVNYTNVDFSKMAQREHSDLT